jgi:hypothetical protein
MRKAALGSARAQASRPLGTIVGKSNGGSRAQRCTHVDTECTCMPFEQRRWDPCELNREYAAHSSEASSWLASENACCVLPSAVNACPEGGHHSPSVLCHTDVLWTCGCGLQRITRTPGINPKSIADDTQKFEFSPRPSHATPLGGKCFTMEGFFWRSSPLMAFITTTCSTWHPTSWGT